MNLNALEASYVQVLLGQSEVEGGMRYRQWVTANSLDGSLESLKTIDVILDDIREHEQPNTDIIGEVDARNFLNAVAFYVGHVVGKENGKPVEWMTNDDVAQQNPELHKVIGDGFEVSIVFKTPRSLAFPLPSIMTRLFEGPEEKSVWYSAQLSIGSAPEAASATAPATKKPLRTIRTKPKPEPKPWWKLW